MIRSAAIGLFASSLLPLTCQALELSTTLKSITLSPESVEDILKTPDASNILNKPLEGVGSGFDIFTGELKNPECVKFGSLSDDNEADNGIKNPSFFHQVENISQFRKESQIEASASLTYKVFSAGFSSQQMNGSYFNSYDKYAFMYNRATVKSRSLKSLELTEPAKVLLKTDVPAFRAKCGDAFIKGYELGGVFSALIRIHTTDDTKYASNKTAISAGISGLLSGQVGTGSAYEAMTKVADVTTEYVNDGGIEVDPRPETALDYFKSFRLKARANPVRIAYITTSYRDIFGREVDALPKLTEEVLVAISILAEKREAARQALNDLNLASQHPTIFVDVAAVPAKQVVVQNYLTSIAAAVDKCRVVTDLRDCSLEVAKIGEAPKTELKEK